jgi:alkanesulfonate monooxygenase SsuD/methylene tetrahydromethanopterin reductase-like flavin-dependent oxidoreductase (luciferase family)
MKAALFSSVPYQGPVERRGWPVDVTSYTSEAAEASMQRALDQFELADQLGFDWVTVAEHHYAPMCLTPNPMVMAGALTQRVKRAKIALLGSNIPIQNPVRVAEEFSMLDTLTHGRIVAGMLRGTSNEYVTYATNPGESRDRFEEAMELIIKCWTEPQPFGWQGRYYEYRAISIWPRPVQHPHPPIYMSASSPEMAEWAAKHRVSIGFAVTRVPLAKQSADLYKKVARESGWEPAPEDVLYRVGCHVAETDEEAFEALAPPPGAAPQRAGGFSSSNRALDDAVADAGYYGRDIENQRGRVQSAADLQQRIANGQILAGSPDTVLRQIQHIRDELGAGIVETIFAGGSPERTKRSIELFGSQVLPRLRDL